jgi:glycosyltransferase involved in cell wall biosynthesis
MSTTGDSMTSAGALTAAAARPIRVVMVSDWHAKYVTPLARAIADHGAEVQILTRDHDLEFGGANGEVAAGTMARWVAEQLDGRGEHLQLPGRIREASALPALLGLHRTLRRRRPDVVHFQDSAAQDARLLAAANVRSRRYAVTIHDVSQHPGDKVRGRRTAWVRKQLIANAGLLFVHSAVLRDALIEKERPSAPIVVIPHGTAPVEAPPPLPAEPSLLFFGRISRYKGIDVLLDAMRLLWERLPEARLVIAGGGDLTQHAALADPRVSVRNEHVPEDDVPSLFAAARCVVLPYLEASQSGVGARAKGYGRPLVVTDVGGIPDLVADGSGRVVPAVDAVALSRALHEVLTVPSLAEEMGRTALASATETSWPRVAELTLESYSDHLIR